MRLHRLFSYHGDSPPDPAGVEKVLLKDELAGVAEDDHERRSGAQLPGLAEGLFRAQVHDEDNFDEEKWDGEEPVHVAVGVVEGNAGQVGGLRHVDALCGVVQRRGVRVRFDPGVEDAQVVVGWWRSNEERVNNKLFICSSQRRNVRIMRRCAVRCQAFNRATRTGDESNESGDHQCRL